MHIRLASPADAPEMGLVSFEAFRDDDLMNYFYPQADKYPWDWQRNQTLKMRMRLVEPDYVLYVAVADESDAGFKPGQILGTAALQRCGGDESARKWYRDTAWKKVERWLIGWEKWYQDTVLDYATNWKGLNAFLKISNFKYYDILGNYWYLQGMAVLPQARRKGIGRKLMEIGMDMAREDSVPVALEASTIGARLYEDLGFSTFDIVHFADLDPGILMLWEPESLKGTWLEEVDGRMRLKGPRYN